MAEPAPDDPTERLRSIVQAAVLAPSAENTQPWKFAIKSNSIIVYLDQSRTLTSDIGSMLSLTAIGACIENAVVAASCFDWQTDVQVTVDQLATSQLSKVVKVAELSFSAGRSRDRLADYLETRSTRRRINPNWQVQTSQLDELRQSCQNLAKVELAWVDRPRLAEFAELVGLGNRIRLEHEPFHKELYDNLRFSPDEAESTRDGLDVATLQLPSALASVLFSLRYWPRMRWANWIGFSRSVARQAAKEVRDSGGVGVLTVPSCEPQFLIDGGRAMERIWLSATRLGLAFHPTASLPVFLAYAQNGIDRLLPRHRVIAKEMSQRFQRLFPELGERMVQMAFRIGYESVPPRVRSLRRNIDDVLQVK